MSDKDLSTRFQSSEFLILRKLLQCRMYQPLLEEKPLPVHARLCIGLDLAALVLPVLLIVSAIVLGDRFHLSGTNVATVIAFLIGLQLAPSTAAKTFGLGPATVIARLIDHLRLAPRKRAFERHCEHIGRAFDLRTDYLPQRVKIWLSHLASTRAFASQPSFVRTLAARSTQARLCEMELAEKLVTAIENGASEPVAALRTALQGCHWMDPSSIEQAAQTDLPAAA